MSKITNDGLTGLALIMSTVGVKGLINSYLVTAGPGVYLASPITPGHNDDFHLFQ